MISIKVQVFTSIFEQVVSRSCVESIDIQVRTRSNPFGSLYGPTVTGTPAKRRVGYVFDRPARTDSAFTRERSVGDYSCSEERRRKTISVRGPGRSVSELFFSFFFFFRIENSRRTNRRRCRVEPTRNGPGQTMRSRYPGRTRSDSIPSRRRVFFLM